jgi:uncharacterized protein YbjT (DUF2867 family)
MSQSKDTILVAGARGRFGRKVAAALLDKGYDVRLLVRPPAASGLDDLVKRGATVVEGDLARPDSLDGAVRGVAAVVSTVNGGPDVIVEGQGHLLRAAERHGVRRFIPSDYSLDYFALDDGDNVFLDLRKRFAETLRASAVPHTFVLIGGFMDVMFELPGGPFDFERGVVSYWGSGEERFDVTTMDDSARFLAEVVLDARAENQIMEFAGDVVSIRAIASAFEEAMARRLEQRRLGSVDDLRRWIDTTKATAKSPFEYVFAQYGWAQLSGKGELKSLANAQFPQLRPTGIRAFLEGRFGPASRTPPGESTGARP